MCIMIIILPRVWSFDQFIILSNWVKTTITINIIDPPLLANHYIHISNTQTTSSFGNPLLRSRPEAHFNYPNDTHTLIYTAMDVPQLHAHLNGLKLAISRDAQIINYQTCLHMALRCCLMWNLQDAQRNKTEQNI